MANSKKAKIIYSTLTTALVLSTFQSSTSQGFGIKANNFGQPVHETITTKAAIESGAITRIGRTKLEFISPNI